MSELNQTIRGSIHVGWRKGVDGEGSGRMYSALAAAFSNSELRIRGIGEAHVGAIADAVEKVIEEGGDEADIAKAAKEAAIAPRQVGPQNATPTFDNQGMAILRMMLPIEFEQWGASRRLENEAAGHFQITEERDGQRRTSTFLNKGDVGTEMIALVALKMVMDSPELRAKYESLLNDTAPAIAQEITDASKEVTEEGWLALAAWICYCID